MITMPTCRALAAFLLAGTLAACGHGNLLHEYDYRDRGLAVVSEIPVQPDVLSGSLFDFRTSGDPLRDAIRVGARVVREVEASGLQARLDSAAMRVDVGYVLEERTHERAARYLGADAVGPDDDADFVLELIVVDYGVVADAWDAGAEFYIEADAALLDEEWGTEIWRAEVSAREPLGPRIWGGSRTLRDVVTASVLATLDVDELAALMEGLADFSARVVTDRLRDDLRDARRREREGG
jgi:hypothetical protein